MKIGTACWKLGTRFGQSTDCLCGLCYICVFLHDNLNNMQIVVLGVVGPEMAMDFGSKEVEPRLMKGGLSMDSPRIVFRVC